MFFKIYFNEEKFRKDVEAFNQKQIVRAARDYYRTLAAIPDEQCISPSEARAKILEENIVSAVNSIDAAREGLSWLDTWDNNKKFHIDSNLKKAKDFLDGLLWTPIKGKEKDEQNIE